MFKKLMFILAATFGFSSADENTAQTLALVAGATAVVGTTVYWSMRESNDEKIERVHDWMTYYSGNLHHDLAKITNMNDMQEFANQSLKFKKEIAVFCKGVHQSYAEMNARYNSWVKPWNWSSKMKTAYRHIKELHTVVCMIEIMFQFQPFMTLLDQEFDEAMMVKKAHSVCHGASSYPMIYCVHAIHNSLYFLQKNYLKVSCDIVLIEFLEKILDLIVNSTQYIEERRIQEEMAIKEREARAHEAQVTAQIMQAKAQSDQARAQEERNRIERDKLNHKKNQ